jgi:hypothetical protein
MTGYVLEVYKSLYKYKNVRWNIDVQTHSAVGYFR